MRDYDPIIKICDVDKFAYSHLLFGIGCIGEFILGVGHNGSEKFISEIENSLSLSQMHVYKCLYLH